MHMRFKSMDAERYARRGYKRVEGWLSDVAAQMIVSAAEAQYARGIRGGMCEIGVHHGRLFILLHLLTHVPELSVAFDLYELQHEQTRTQRKARLEANLHSNGAALERIRIITQDSRQLKAERIMELCAGRPRLFSIDGGRDAATTHNDLTLAHATICDGGLIMVGDYFQESWPEVSEGVCRFMLQDNRDLHPVAIGGNKLLFARSHDATQCYQDELAHQFQSHMRWSVMFGERVLLVLPTTLRTRIAGSRPWRAIRETRLGNTLRTFGQWIR